MIVSPLFINGLGNRLYQLAAASYFAYKTNSTLTLVDLPIDLKQRYYKEFGCFKLDDMLENGGHPTKYKLTDVFDLPISSRDQKEGSPLLEIYVRTIDDAILPKTESDCIHIHGNFMFADIVEQCFSLNIFPRWQPSFQPPLVEMTDHVVHIRIYYGYDNIIDPTYLKNERIEGVMTSISPIPLHEKRWTIFSNDPSKIPTQILSMAKYVHGPEVDVYETLRYASHRDVKVLVMSCSTFSSWMAFLGSHEQVFCPKEYVDIHGQRSYSNKWRFY